MKKTSSANKLRYLLILLVLVTLLVSFVSLQYAEDNYMQNQNTVVSEEELIVDNSGSEYEEMREEPRLQPRTTTYLTVSNTEDVSEFMFYVRKLELAPELTTPRKNITLFVPVNEAFSQYNQFFSDLDAAGDINKQRAIILNHVIDGFVREDGDYKSKAGDFIVFNKNEGMVESRLENASILASVETDNGFVYFVDSLLIPTF